MASLQDFWNDRTRSAPVLKNSLLNATPEQLLDQLGGKPNRKVWVASQGQLIEQWVYFGPRLNQYVNIVRRPGDPQPRVVSYYSLPRDAAGAPSAP